MCRLLSSCCCHTGLSCCTGCCQTELYRLSSDAATFLTEPAESERVRYEVWSADLDLEARQTELSDLLASNRTLLHQYTQLVPAQVSHVLFWHR